MSKKIYILDTNILLHDGEAIKMFDNNTVVLPLIVLEELDRKKNGSSDIAANARKVIRLLDEARADGKLTDGVKINNNGGEVKIDISSDFSLLPDVMSPDDADNRIIVCALRIMNECDSKVTVITKDINMRVKCASLDIEVEDYNKDFVREDINKLYGGIFEKKVDTSIIDSLLDGDRIDVKEIYKSRVVYENEYGYLCSNDGAKRSVLVKCNDGLLEKIKSYPSVFGASSRNKEQACLMDALMDPKIKLVTAIGKAGTGKTYIASACALEQVIESKLYKRIIISKPVVPMGKELGFLPGNLVEKMLPWLAPFADNVNALMPKGTDSFEFLMDQGIIKIEALSHVRGRSIADSIILIDEAQNLSPSEAKGIITRVGNNSKIVLCGDLWQIDNPYVVGVSSGMANSIEKLKFSGLTSHVTLTKGERSDLATLAADLL